MGNGILCRCEEKIKTPPELTFATAENCPCGRLDPVSIRYLSNKDLALFKLSAASNLVGLKLLLLQQQFSSSSSSLLSVKISDTNRTSPLHVACRCGQAEIIKQLLKAGGDINLADVSGWTPMHVATDYQRQDLLRQLITRGANPYIKNKKNKTVYQLLRNQTMKQLATQHLIDGNNHDDGKQVGELIEKQDYRSVREIYDRCIDKMDTRHKNRQSLADAISFDQEASIGRRVEADIPDYVKKAILEDRKYMLRLWFTQIQVLKDEIEIKQKNHIETDHTETFIRALGINPTWGMQLMRRKGQALDAAEIADFLLVNRRRLKQSLFKILTNLEVAESWEICYRFISECITAFTDDLRNSLHCVFSEMSIEFSILHIDFISFVFSRCYSIKKGSRLGFHKQNSLHRLVFSLLVNSIRRQINSRHQEPHQRHSWTTVFPLNKIIKDECEVMQLSPTATLELLEFSQTRLKGDNKFKESVSSTGGFLEQEPYSIVKLEQQVGKLYGIKGNGVWLFVGSSKLLVFQPLAVAQKYCATEIPGQHKPKVVDLKDMLSQQY